MNDRQLGTPAQYAQAPTPPSPYEEHISASQEWAAACQMFADAAQRKDAAAKRLAQATERLGQLLQSAQTDPTVAVPTNGGVYANAVPQMPRY